MFFSIPGVSGCCPLTLPTFSTMENDDTTMTGFLCEAKHESDDDRSLYDNIHHDDLTGTAKLIIMGCIL